jgi:hypothetical protein
VLPVASSWMEPSSKMLRVSEGMIWPYLYAGHVGCDVSPQPETHARTWLLQQLRMPRVEERPCWECVSMCSWAIGTLWLLNLNPSFLLALLLGGILWFCVSKPSTGLAWPGEIVAGIIRFWVSVEMGNENCSHFKSLTFIDCNRSWGWHHGWL